MGTLDSPWGNNFRTPGKNNIEAISIHLSWKFLLFQVIYYQLTRKYHTYLIDSQYSFLIEEMISLIKFVTEWHLQVYKTSGFYFLLILLVNSPSSTSTLRLTHSSGTLFLVNPLSFQCHLHQYHLVLPWLWKLFLKGCPLHLKRDFLWK